MRHSLCRIVSHMSLNSRVRNLNVRCFNGYFSLAELIILSDQFAKKQFRSSSFNFQFRSNSPWPLSSSPQYVKQSTPQTSVHRSTEDLRVFYFQKYFKCRFVFAHNMCSDCQTVIENINRTSMLTNYISSVSNRLRQHARKIG